MSPKQHVKPGLQEALIALMSVVGVQKTQGLAHSCSCSEQSLCQELGIGLPVLALCSWAVGIA